MVPLSRNGVGSFASASGVVSGRGCSSRPITSASCRRRAITTGTISRAKKPDAMAAPARCWLRHANRSWSAREMPNSAATFSPVSGIESTPYCALNSGFTKRQPSVVS